MTNVWTRLSDEKPVDPVVKRQPVYVLSRWTEGRHAKQSVQLAIWRDDNHTEAWMGEGFYSLGAGDGHDAFLGHASHWAYAMSVDLPS